MENPQKENGHLDIANELVEVLAKTQLSNYESRILWAIWRKTWAWHKKVDWISFSQLKQLTKITQNSHISRTLKLLVMKNIVTKGGNKYGFNKHYGQWVKLPKGVNTHHLPKGVTELPKGDGELPKGELTKETIQKKLMTKEITTKVVTEKQYGNPDVNNFLSFFKQKFNLGILDGSEAINRRYAWLAIRKCGGLNNALKVIALAAEDDFYGDKIADVKKFYYHMVEITKKRSKDSEDFKTKELLKDIKTTK